MVRLENENKSSQLEECRSTIIDVYVRASFLRFEGTFDSEEGPLNFAYIDIPTLYVSAGRIRVLDARQILLRLDR